jgi:hypothetical protein
LALIVKRKVPQSRKGFPQAPLGRVGRRRERFYSVILKQSFGGRKCYRGWGEELGIMASSAASSEYHAHEIEGGSSNTAALPKSLMMMRSPLGSTTSMYDFVKVQQPHSTIFTSSFQSSQIDSNVGKAHSNLHKLIPIFTSSFKSSQDDLHLHKLIPIFTSSLESS